MCVGLSAGPVPVLVFWFCLCRVCCALRPLLDIRSALVGPPRAVSLALASALAMARVSRCVRRRMVRVGSAGLLMEALLAVDDRSLRVGTAAGQSLPRWAIDRGGLLLVRI